MDNPAETMLTNITPALNGVLTDILTACVGLIFLALILTAFYVIYGVLFAHEKADDDGVSSDEKAANYQRAIRDSDAYSPYERDVARTKYRRMVNDAARGGR